MSEQYTAEIPKFGLGDRMRLALDFRGYSIQQCATYLGVNRNTVGNWIGGRVVPPLMAIRAFAGYVRVPVEWLQTGKEPDPDGGPGSPLPRLDSNQEPPD